MPDSIFSKGFFVHIFHGRIWQKEHATKPKPEVKVSGIHHEGAGMVAVVGVKVLDSTRSKKDRGGVYTACVCVSRNGLCGWTKTSFFPAEWTRWQVLEAIHEVYQQRPVGYKSWGWDGYSSTGVHIFMLLDKEQKIITAWPKRAYRKPSKRRADKRRRLAKRAMCKTSGR